MIYMGFLAAPGAEAAWLSCPCTTTTTIIFGGQCYFRCHNKYICIVVAFFVNFTFSKKIYEKTYFRRPNSGHRK
jgi:hypothetical protein